MSIRLESARDSLRRQPFSAMLGTELVALNDGSAELRLPIADALRQQHGFVHGGVVSYLADNALAFAGGSVLGPAVVTGEYKVNFLRPAVGEALVARGVVIHAGKGQAVCRCEIHAVAADGSDKLIACAQGTIQRIGEAPGGAGSAS